MKLRYWANALLLAAVAWAAPVLARGPQVDAPVLLAASPQLSGSYARTVLLALPTGHGTHIGFILNRPTEIHLAAVFPELPAAKQIASPVFVGGPHLRETLLALTLSPIRPSEEAVEVLPELFMTFGTTETAHVASRFPARSRFYAGLVAWDGGELQAEVQAGAWHVLEPDVQLVIGGSADTLWERVLERVHTLVAMR